MRYRGSPKRIYARHILCSRCGGGTFKGAETNLAKAGDIYIHASYEVCKQYQASEFVRVKMEDIYAVSYYSGDVGSGQRRHRESFDGLYPFGPDNTTGGAVGGSPTEGDSAQ